MATIPTASHGSYKNSARRIYVAAKAFNNDFYTYTVTTDPITGNTTGALSVVTADANKTPVGRTLREVGRKLYPGANPGVTTYMVKVYDDQTGLSGYINPNSAVFAIFNTDKPTYLPDGSEVAGGSYSGQNEGNSVYTIGTVMAGASVSAGTSISAGTTITAGKYVAGAVSILTRANGGIDTGGSNNTNIYANPLNGNVFLATIDNFYINANGKVAYVYFGPSTTESVPPAGSTVSLVLVNSSGYNINVTFNGTPGVVIGASNLNIGTSGFLNGTRRGFTFVSDGSKLYCTGLSGAY
jgi:hypothetical protein